MQFTIVFWRKKKKPAGDFEFKQIIDFIADCSCLCVRSLVDIYESWVGNFEALQFRKSWQQSFDFDASISEIKVGSKIWNVLCDSVLDFRNLMAGSFVQCACQQGTLYWNRFCIVIWGQLAQQSCFQFWRESTCICTPGLSGF